MRDVSACVAECDRDCVYQMWSHLASSLRFASFASYRVADQFALEMPRSAKKSEVAIPCRAMVAFILTSFLARLRGLMVRVRLLEACQQPPETLIPRFDSRDPIVRLDIAVDREILIALYPR